MDEYTFSLLKGEDVYVILIENDLHLPDPLQPEMSDQPFECLGEDYFGNIKVRWFEPHDKGYEEQFASGNEVERVNYLKSCQQLYDEWKGGYFWHFEVIKLHSDAYPTYETSCGGMSGYKEDEIMGAVEEYISFPDDAVVIVIDRREMKGFYE